MDKGLKDKIIKLRKEGKSYRKISNILECSRATISYHCKRNNLENIGLRRKLNEGDIKNIKLYYKEHTIKETALKFKISESTVKYHVENKRIPLTEDEKKLKNYIRLKTYRQRTKDKAVEYKGGKCEKCGYNKCNWSLHFHHIDPTKKEFTFSRYSNHSWEKIKNELDKCIMICSNCHGEIHYELACTDAS